MEANRDVLVCDLSKHSPNEASSSVVSSSLPVTASKTPDLLNAVQFYVLLSVPTSQQSRPSKSLLRQKNCRQRQAARTVNTGALHFVRVQSELQDCYAFLPRHMAVKEFLLTFVTF